MLVMSGASDQRGERYPSGDRSGRIPLGGISELRKEDAGTQAAVRAWEAPHALSFHGGIWDALRTLHAR